MTSPRIVRVEVARLEGTRPRMAGSNARLDAHGITVRPTIARLTTDGGTTGIGPARLTTGQAEALLGRRLDDLFRPEAGAVESIRPTANAGSDWLSADLPVWELAAKLAGLPVYALAARVAGQSIPTGPFAVPCYDTSLYFDDLHLRDNAEAAALIATEAREGYARGHRAFKMKVGRGARHLPLEEGTQRDIAVVRAVRQAVGPDCPLMIDANNGYNLNLTKRVLSETADCRLHWLEEAFHEDVVLYRDLRAWLAAEGLGILIADGEGQASPTLLDWAREGVIDVVQYDINHPGFTNLLAIGQKTDAWGRKLAPHHYGGFFGNFVCGHLAAAVRGFAAVEWDEASIPGVDVSRYRLQDGRVTLPEVPGFGLEYDEETLARAVAETGFAVALKG